jgi:hypothetical protein
MPKVIMYLDQNFVSNMAKARTGSLKDQGWLHLYEILSSLVRNQQKVVCPESLFHEIESNLSGALVQAIQQVVNDLAWGLKLKPWQALLRWQVYQAMHKFLGKEEPPPSWREVFSHDPEEPTRNRSIVLNGRELLVYTPWGSLPELTESDLRLKEKLPKAMADIRKAVAGKDFASQVEVEKRTFVEVHYRGAELPMLHDMWKNLGGEKTKLENFLFSDCFKTCRFVDIVAHLYAGLAVLNPDRTPKASDYYDALILATVMPYCAVIAGDSYMKHLVEQIELDKRYGVQMFSAKQDDLEQLVAFLQSL